MPNAQMNLWYYETDAIAKHHRTLVVSMPHPNRSAKSWALELEKFCARRSAFERESKIKQQHKKKDTKCRHTVKSASHKPSRPKWMPEMPKGLKPEKEGFFTPLIFV